MSVDNRSYSPVPRGVVESLVTAWKEVVAIEDQARFGGHAPNSAFGAFYSEKHQRMFFDPIKQAYPSLEEPITTIAQLPRTALYGRTSSGSRLSEVVARIVAPIQDRTAQHLIERTLEAGIEINGYRQARDVEDYASLVFSASGINRVNPLQSKLLPKLQPAKIVNAYLNGYR